MLLINLISAYAMFISLITFIIIRSIGMPDKYAFIIFISVFVLTMLVALAIYWVIGKKK